MISVLKVLLFIALVAASVAVLPRCSFAGSSSGPTGQYRAGCMCRFDDGSQKCVLKGPTGYDLSYLESSLSPYGVYYAASTSSGGTTYSGMCTVSSGTAPFLSGNTTLCPMAIGICNTDGDLCCRVAGCDECYRYTTCQAAPITRTPTTSSTTTTTTTASTPAVTPSTTITTTGTTTSAGPTTSTSGGRSDSSSSTESMSDSTVVSSLSSSSSDVGLTTDTGAATSDTVSAATSISQSVTVALLFVFALEIGVVLTFLS
jgi:hypothetical protein